MKGHRHGITDFRECAWDVPPPRSPALRTVLDAVVVEPAADHTLAGIAARQQGRRAGEDYDSELVFLICVLHDMGLTEGGNADQRFEVAGADLAARFLEEHGEILHQRHPVLPYLTWDMILDANTRGD